MRSLVKQVQDVYFAEITERNEKYEKVKVYNITLHKRMSVSWGTGDVIMLGSGTNEDYDRQILSFDRDFKVHVGTMVYIDVKPKIDKKGRLIMSEDGITPITLPDYVVVKIIDTDKGCNARICVKKV